MKRLFVLFGIIAAIPALAFAQATPTPNMPRHPDFQMMRQNMQRHEALHRQFRANVLAALTPAHRSLLASLVGQLAIAPSPDPRAAAQRLDAALSSGERNAIAAAEQSFMAQQRSFRDQMMGRPSHAPRVARMMDPGELLLMLAIGHGPMEPGFGIMRRGGFGPPGGFMPRRPGPTPSPQ
ncbi:MAG TPA: hypothetical protein VGR69_04735 [Candidatus Rubrimentiphilum sp.]|nr:hypothetical protein [Candidatus Rubrimentiphilum sp.]